MAGVRKSYAVCFAVFYFRIYSVKQSMWKEYKRACQILLQIHLKHLSQGKKFLA